jgi:hypothetical protein
MATLTEIEKLAFELPERQRGILASKLLQSLKAVLDDDDGYAEASRRDAEMDENPEMEISLEELDHYIKSK